MQVDPNITNSTKFDNIKYIANTIMNMANQTDVRMIEPKNLPN
jgi:hypothetical protein